MSYGIHTECRIPAKNLRLVLASSDYDEIYSAGSPTQDALSGVARMRRLVFVGFGFRDPDLIQILQRCARLGDPARPAFAFLSDTSQEDRERLRKQFNLEVIPYVRNGSDHSDLHSQLATYGAFVVGRDVGYGQPLVGSPSYDEEVTSLIVSNRLKSDSGNSKGPLVQSLIVSILRRQPSASVGDLAAFFLLTVDRLSRIRLGRCCKRDYYKSGNPLCPNERG